LQNSTGNQKSGPSFYTGGGKESQKKFKKKKFFFSKKSKKISLKYFFLARKQALFDGSGAKSQTFSYQCHNELEIGIAKKIVELSKIKSKSEFFGGDTPNYADVEIFGLLNFMETYEPVKFNEQLKVWTIESWYLKMKKILFMEELSNVPVTPLTEGTDSVPAAES